MRPKIGVGVLVINDGNLLLGERIHSHGANTWCPPGGHLEMWEAPEECAARELMEEAGIEAVKIETGPWTNDCFHEEGKHYLTLWMIVREFKGEPVVMEPEKCGTWKWFPIENLPNPLFLSLTHLLENHHESIITSAAGSSPIA